MTSKFALGGAVAAGLACLAYHCYSPTSQLYGCALTHSPDPRRLALTYDDGPNDVHTPRLLEVLATHNVQATFFLIGRFVALRPQIAREIARGGHLIANHTFSHPNLLFLSARDIRSQLLDCSQAIADATGAPVRYFRPPFGARRPAVFDIARDCGLTPVMWTVTCFDWRRTTAAAVARTAEKRIVRDCNRGHIILMHDGGHKQIGADRSHSVEATDNLIRRYGRQYEFRRIDEMGNS